MIENLIQNPHLIALLLGLIITVIIGFKVLQTVVETLLVSLVSAAFYLGLVAIINLPLTLELLLIFTIAGSGIYIGLKILYTTWAVTKMAVKVPTKIIALTSSTVKAISTKVKNSRSSGKNSKGEQSKEDVKETVIEKIGEED